MKMDVKILLVEDDTSLGFVIADQLKSDGYQVTLCTDGAEGFQRFNQDQFHLCICDVMMPKKDGFTLAKEIRQVNTDIPILFLTAKGEAEDRVEGFKSGGDDYLTKPFHSEELQLRVAALLKRVNIASTKAEEDLFKIGSYTFDSVNFELTHRNFSKVLTKKEAQVLKFLAKAKNEIVPRELILNAVWGQDDYFVGRSLDVFITKLRKYFKEDKSIQIMNVHGRGFRLSDQ